MLSAVGPAEQAADSSARFDGFNTRGPCVRCDGFKAVMRWLSGGQRCDGFPGVKVVTALRRSKPHAETVALNNNACVAMTRGFPAVKAEPVAHGGAGPAGRNVQSGTAERHGNGRCCAARAAHALLGPPPDRLRRQARRPGGR